MAAILRNTVLFMFVWLMLAGVCLAKQVYLKDGGIIECESFWRQGDKVIVKINRDTVVDFQKNEIDARRTFRDTGKKSHHVRQAKSAGAVMPLRAATPVAVAAAVAPAPAPIPVGPKAPAAAPAVNPAPAPLPAANETVQLEPTQTASDEASSPPGKAELNARYAGMIRKIVLISLVVCLLLIVSTWVVFEKAGEAGWKSLIPFYNMYILFIISGKPGWWLILMFVPVVSIVFYLLAMLTLAQKFGRGALFGIGLWLLPMLFFPILAFGGSQYEG
jgi:hypothetical protein